MPFIDSKISIKITDAQEKELKARLGQAIALLPGKSETWLMTGFEDNYHLYFRGDNSNPMAFVEVSILGTADSGALSNMTAEITKIFGEVLGIAGEMVYVKYSSTQDWGWNGGNF
ncbi:MAG: hypothetical protein J5643_10635 [Lachnospiraceae bacterium]|nr:hypothetical protein [Lachnospiraceae bacterium]